MVYQHRNITHQLVHDLGSAILRGQYKVGDNLPTEANIGAQFNTSRTSTREAIKILSAKGLIATKPRLGIKVQPSKHWNLFDADVLNWILLGKPDLYMLRSFQQLRLAIEPEAAYIAGQQAQAEDLQIIENALERMKNATTSDDSTLEADIDFHKSILSASNNPFFIQLINFVDIALQVNMRFTDRITPVTQEEYQAHANVYHHIKNAESQLAYDSALISQKMTLEVINKKIQALES
jgi:DNA-binding FadR family transcriptional regulator